MARAKRENTTKTADAELFKRHDAFAKSYAKMTALADQDATGEGSLSTGTKRQKTVHRKWEAAADDAFEKARVVIETTASTLEGMLMKLHVAGFAITDTKVGTFTGPYRSNIRLWEPGKFAEGEEIAIIVSLRNDLHRFAGRRV
jgi:hypothetical protein